MGREGLSSGYPNGYSRVDAMKNIQKSVSSNENVILDTTKMTPGHVAELRSAIAREPSLAGKVIWWP